MTRLFERFFRIGRPREKTRPSSLNGTPWTEDEKNRLLRLRAEFPGLTLPQFQKRFFPARSESAVKTHWQKMKAGSADEKKKVLIGESTLPSPPVSAPKRRSQSPPRHIGRRYKVPRISDTKSESESEYEDTKSSDESIESHPEAGDIDGDGVTRRHRYPLRSTKYTITLEPDGKHKDTRNPLTKEDDKREKTKPTQDCAAAYRNTSPAAKIPGLVLPLNSDPTLATSTPTARNALTRVLISPNGSVCAVPEPFA
ncbi:hypothetical protein BDV06DRAFT_119395 [Aspergillus oleicola]